ncbi:hypothetical protein Purlil1_11957 [Purpureocillium lilacinum]|uniref:JmjC domain-containing protein n=1 Tax=Purpureocillium lilacinum TaxID=33203 RepID=A0ABR0BI35_PURLI|nr:hypothetical protein Purlil1_11957 [Purpureocillium lilacinum]
MCERIFLYNGKRQHEYGTGHASYLEVNLPNSEQHVFGPTILTRSTTSESLTSSENVDTARMRRKYGSLIRSLLRECQNSRSLLESNDTRWSSCLQLLCRILPEDREIPIARIGAISDTADSVEVWYASPEEMRPFVHQDFVLRKPTVIRSRQPIWGQDLGSFLEALNDDFAGSLVDVQDPSTSATDKKAVQMPVDAVIKRIKEGSDIRDGPLPLNLLDLKCSGHDIPTPGFLQMPRFRVLSTICTRLGTKFSGEGVAGKRGHDTAAELDLERSLTFSMFAQRGSFTGFHVDCPDGTWVCNQSGLKLWIFATSKDEADMATFADEGDDWVPKTVAAIVLEPGDTLIMPPGEIVPHAVLTLEDSRMTGGMFMDAHRIVDSAQKLLWIATHPAITNEAIPLQLLSGWEHLRDLLLAKNQSVADHAKFDEITELLRKTLSCQCRGPCRKRCSGCRCSLSAAQDWRCTSWCHPPAPAPGK